MSLFEAEKSKTKKVRSYLMNHEKKHKSQKYQQKCKIVYISYIITGVK